METFENVYLDISKQPGRCRMRDGGLGWKPSGEGDTFTLEGQDISSAQWSRAAKGYEMKILSRKGAIHQLDGFDGEVSERMDASTSPA